MKTAIVLAACWLGSVLVGCAEYRSTNHNSDSYRSEAYYYSGKPGTVREAEEVDGRSGAYKSAPAAGAPASPVQ
jgi:hypothetical protein